MGGLGDYYGGGLFSAYTAGSATNNVVASYYDYNTLQTVYKQQQVVVDEAMAAQITKLMGKPAAAAPAKSGNLDWLDKRVNEMRVQL